MADEKTFFSFPVVITDKEIPPGEIIFGRLPTAQELLESGLSLEEWCAKESGKIKDLDAS